MKTKEDIKQLVLDRFVATNSQPNHVVDQRWLNFNLPKGLNAKELELIDPAINDLIAEGMVYVDNRAGGICLVLTEEGYNHIYPINNSAAKNKIQDGILDLFSRTNSKPNHVIHERQLSFGFYQTLNPKEQLLIDDAINDLIEAGYITREKRSSMDCLVLTEIGYEHIYE